MASKTVTVLTIHGRRQNVKVEANTTILEVLEQVCSKFNFNALEFDLKHHSKIMDLSVMFRFSGLPNNALLEMVPATKVRTEQDIILVLQLEDGTRLNGTFKSSANLLDVLETLCKEKANAESNPVMIYMRREVLWDSLDRTTLKSLGLTGGRAIIRLLQRKPEELKTQAHVSAPLPQREKVDDLVSDSLGKVSSAPSNETNQKEACSDLSPQILAKKPKGEELCPLPGPSNAGTKPKPILTNEDPVREDKAPRPRSIINILGDRDAVLFHQESVEHSSQFDLPDSFFDITVKDVQKMYADLKSKVKELEEQPLMTSDLRKLEEEKRILNSLARYKNTIIRIQFPDRYILQGIFKLHETVADVIAFIITNCEKQLPAIHLYTTPPKIILSPESTLVEAKCVPQAILHVGFEGDVKPDKPLRADLYERLSNATGAAELAAQSRKNAYGSLPSTTSSVMEIDLEEDTGNAAGTERSLNRIPNANFRPSSVQSATSSGVKTPKWFKPVGK
ncbi:tether containing UBX domain for GLUT4 [Armigeres subalbatus]|uniref:tether containing UBX domain for GLUT4 n=1 Tax=Armigeres subalbatus TaxID=124917 RepID=UPI002ED4BA23